MQFTPKNDQELETSNLLPEGTYSYIVVGALEKTSMQGNQYIALKLDVHDGESKNVMLFSNLAFIKLLKHFCDVNGLQAQYEAGELHAQDCLHKSKGSVQIGIEPAKPNPNGGFYRTKNVVLDYVPGEQKLAASKIDLGDDIPF